MARRIHGFEGWSRSRRWSCAVRRIVAEKLTSDRTRCTRPLLGERRSTVREANHCASTGPPGPVIPPPPHRRSMRPGRHRPMGVARRVARVGRPLQPQPHSESVPQDGTQTPMWCSLHRSEKDRKTHTRRVEVATPLSSPRQGTPTFGLIDSQAGTPVGRPGPTRR